ncbi:hypothetical protein [Bacillus kwashiorkori]|uniref:hypothetical protein n=1 Tax=Bacillus kwashiorkori TaxID=1522318 RepID=UPI000783C768|nr:hypothetical protein [Bacillus kwashiorkori]
MSRKKSIFQRFHKQLETRDDHFDDELRSHYYKTSFDKVFQAVTEVFQKDQTMEISSTSKERGELAIHMKKNPHAFIVVTVIQTRPFETAVDFMVSSDKFSIIGLYPALKKIVVGLYKELDKKLPSIGVK